MPLVSKLILSQIFVLPNIFWYQNQIFVLPKIFWYQKYLCYQTYTGTRYISGTKDLCQIKSMGMSETWFDFRDQFQITVVLSDNLLSDKQHELKLTFVFNLWCYLWKLGLTSLSLGKKVIWAIVPFYEVINLRSILADLLFPFIEHELRPSLLGNPD